MGYIFCSLQSQSAFGHVVLHAEGLPEWIVHVLQTDFRRKLQTDIQIVVSLLLHWTPDAFQGQSA